MVKFWKLFLALFVLTVLQSIQACSERGWFGSNCRYQCNCRNESCDASTGECGNDSSCDNGWFGPACQYVDLTVTEKSGSSPTWLYDGDDSTCNTDKTLNKVTVQLEEPFPFTWLRLNVRDRDDLNAIQVQFKKDSSTRNDNIMMDCSNKRTEAVDKYSLDIHCDLNSRIQQVLLSGQGVKSLCSVHISGGRKITLRQPTTQSTSEPNSNSSMADNGNIVTSYYPSKCTRTKSEDKNPNWNLTFEHPHEVNRFRLNYLQNSSITHHLTFYDKDGTSLFPEPRNEEKAVVNYEKILDKPVEPVSVISVTVDSAPPDYKPLILCEVLAYGDTVCPQGKYGRECEHSCDNCLKQECFVATGGCALGCVDGFVGNQCQTPCSATYYGKDCGERCNTNCVDRLCDNIYGICNQCERGKMGHQCEEGCPPTKYGPNCEMSCSTNCENQLCQPINGSCKGCPPGFSGDDCDTSCDMTSYGKNCEERCSANCKDQMCDSSDGTCHLCVKGKRGDMCDQECPPTKYGPNCELYCSTSCENQHCHSVYGVCDDCASGYTGYNCENPCPATTYGRDCTQNCSITCLAKQCNHVNGMCDHCTGGKMGDFCDQDCPPKKYGPNCEMFCSPNCTDQLCDPVYGICSKKCPPGYFGDKCENACESNTYGPDCENECSPHCKRNVTLASSACDHITGSCILGCVDKFSGPMCKTYVKTGGDSTSSPLSGGAITGIVLAVVVPVLFIAGFISYKCGQKKPGTNGQNRGQTYNSCSDTRPKQVPTKDSSSNSRPNRGQAERQGDPDETTQKRREHSSKTAPIGIVNPSLESSTAAANLDSLKTENPSMLSSIGLQSGNYYTVQPDTDGLLANSQA